MAASAQPSTSQLYSPVTPNPPVFDKATSVRTEEASRLVDADGNLTDESTRFFTAQPIAIDTRTARPCNPDVLFPNVVPVAQPLLGLLSWFVRTFERVARFARDQLGLTPSRPDHLVFEPLSLPDTLAAPGDISHRKTISLDEFKQKALPKLPTVPGYFRDKPSSDWAGITNADSRVVLNQCQRDPDQAQFAKNRYEFIPEDRPEDADKIAVPIKAEVHVKGRPSSHGLEGHAVTQQESQEALKKVNGGGTPYCEGPSTKQVALGFNTVDKKTPNSYNAECSAGGSSSEDALLVSAGAASVAIGTDAGNSCGCPSHCNGVVGYKGGRNEKGESFFSRKGSAYETSGVCDLGLIANNIPNLVDFAQYMTDVLPTADSLQYKTSQIAVDTGSLNYVVDAEVAAKERCAVDFWKQENPDHGFHEVDLMSLGAQQGSNNALNAMLAHGTCFAKEEVEVFDNVLSPEQRRNAPASLKANIATARVIEPDQHYRSQIVKLQIEQRLESLYQKGVKFLILPTCNKVAPRVSWWNRHFDSSNPKETFQYSQLSSYANMACLPRMTLPIGHPRGGNGNDHMPMSLSIMPTSRKVDPYEHFAVSREFEIICRQHDELKLNRPEFYIYEQLAEARDRRREQQV